MDALTTVFNTILDVIEIIKKFLSELFPAKEEDKVEGDNAAAEA